MWSKGLVTNVDKTAHSAEFLWKCLPEIIPADLLDTLNSEYWNRELSASSIMPNIWMELNTRCVKLTVFVAAPFTLLITVTEADYFVNMISVIEQGFLLRTHIRQKVVWNIWQISNRLETLKIWLWSNLNLVTSLMLSVKFGRPHMYLPTLLYLATWSRPTFKSV